MSQNPNQQIVSHQHRLEVGENAFWLMLWTVVAIALVALVYLLASYNAKIDAAIIASQDPVAAACATGTHSTVSNQCAALLARKN